MSAERAGAEAGGVGAGRRGPGTGRPVQAGGVSSGASGADAAPSQKRLRDLVRASPLISPEMRAHWLCVLPHLTVEQRQELWSLLAPAAPSASASAGATSPVTASAGVANPP